MLTILLRDVILVVEIEIRRGDRTMNTNLNLTKNYMDSLKVLDTVIDYLDDNGDRTGLRSYALVYVAENEDSSAGYDVLAEPYSVDYDLSGNRSVHWYSRELPESYVIVG